MLASCVAPYTCVIACAFCTACSALALHLASALSCKFGALYVTVATIGGATVL